MKQLRLSPELVLPLEATTQAIGILAKRRAGKSYTARRFAEQLFKAGQQIVIVDPKGDWWGIRSSADGKSPGLPVVILGGERGDVPLEASAGEVVAKLAVEERVSALLDLSLFRKHEVATFMTAFLENLYRLKAREVYRTPLMLFVDEADAIAPQKPQENEARMLGAAEDIVRRGGQRGLGCTLITQRSAVLNKNVLTQVEMLVALRTIAPQDLKALDEWINVHGTREQRATLMESLPSLPKGDAWFWSPGWPTEEGIFQRVHVSKIETFDSGATPKSGEKRVEPKNLADVDLAALTKQMAATIEKAKADDPRALRKEIARLKGELAKAGTLNQGLGKGTKPAAPDPAVIAQHVRAGIVAGMKAEWARIRVATQKLAEARRTLAAAQGAVAKLPALLDGGIAGIDLAIEGLKSETPPPAAHPVVSRSRVVSNPQPASKPEAVSMGTAARTRAPGISNDARGTPSSNGSLSGKGQLILDAIAFYESVGQPEPSRSWVAGFAGMSIGGTLSARLSELRSAGYIVDVGRSQVALTEAGRPLADASRLPQSKEEIHRMWIHRLPGKAGEILRVLLEAYPDSIARAELAERVGMTVGGTFSARLSEIRGPGLLKDVSRGDVRASEVLFPPGLN